MKQKYHVKLSETEQVKLKKQKEGKKVSLEANKRAHALLEMDESNEKKSMTSKLVWLLVHTYHRTIRVIRQTICVEYIFHRRHKCRILSLFYTPLDRVKSRIERGMHR